MTDPFQCLNDQNWDAFAVVLAQTAARPGALEVENAEGETLLALATLHDPIHVTACLEAGCRIDELFGFQSDTALTWCARDGRPDAFRVLATWARAHGIDPHQPNGEGNSPLHIACAYGNAPMVRAILEFRPDPSARDADGATVTEMLNGDHVNDRSAVRELMARYVTETALRTALRRRSP